MVRSTAPRSRRIPAEAAAAARDSGACTDFGHSVAADVATRGRRLVVRRHAAPAHSCRPVGSDYTGVHCGENDEWQRERQQVIQGVVVDDPVDLTAADRRTIDDQLLRLLLERYVGV